MNRPARRAYSSNLCQNNNINRICKAKNVQILGLGLIVSYFYNVLFFFFLNSNKVVV